MKTLVRMTMVGLVLLAWLVLVLFGPTLFFPGDVNIVFAWGLIVCVTTAIVPLIILSKRGQSTPASTGGR